MATICVDVKSRSDFRPTPHESDITAALADAGLSGVESVQARFSYFLTGALEVNAVTQWAARLLADPVTEEAAIRLEQPASPSDGPGHSFEIHLRPGVMDPVAASVLLELRAAGLMVDHVRTARGYHLCGNVDAARLLEVVRGTLANDCIEEIVPGSAGVRPPPSPPRRSQERRTIALSAMSADELAKLSRSAALFLSPDEMLAVQAHFAALRREPSDLELETIAQTWSEHCVHKTLKSSVRYRGAPFPSQGSPPLERPSSSHLRTEPPESESAPGAAPCERRYDNLLKDTIARATRELMAAGAGPECISVFQDNAGVIGFDDHHAVAFKVETHNHPSAIEPYGGAATGIGGCLRDVMGCGLGARPIASTDVFCVAPQDWPMEGLPRGVIHPRFVLRGVVQGVADYGNRIGVPTVNGAVHFDARYLANPLVYCGCVGILPRTLVHKQARDGDLIVVVGGRTGRDGIHGATFSSAEMAETHVDEFAHAVQIGNAIEQKRMLDGLLRARDAGGGCLYSAITDCGAGGLSSAVGEMAAQIGAAVELASVPLKYAGLRYDEIWISEAQERMVVALPPRNLDAFMAALRSEEVEATVIGAFGLRDAAGAPILRVSYAECLVGQLDLEFLHNGLPRRERAAEWTPIPAMRDEGRRGASPADSGHVARCLYPTPATALSELAERLAQPAVAAKHWIVRRYDHEVQGGSVVKPFMGPGRGPSDAAVVRPVLDSQRGVAIGCGMQPELADVDPYWMAAAAVDEAIRNVVCVGGDPRQTAILDNFCWGGCDDPRQMGALVRACQACYDAAVAYQTPFISGKDSLNNQFALEPAAREQLLKALREMAQRKGPDARELAARLPAIEAEIRRTGRLAVPPTLLISAIAIVPDVRRACTSDLKRDGGEVLLIGGQDPAAIDFARARITHWLVADLIREGAIRACHDVSDGGWLTALAEMAIGGGVGARIEADSGRGSEDLAPFKNLAAAYVLQVARDADVRQRVAAAGVPGLPLATVQTDARFRWGECAIATTELRDAWCRLKR